MIHEPNKEERAMWEYATLTMLEHLIRYNRPRAFGLTLAKACSLNFPFKEEVITYQPTYNDAIKYCDVYDEPLNEEELQKIREWEAVLRKLSSFNFRPQMIELNTFFKTNKFSIYDIHRTNNAVETNFNS